LPQNWVLNDLNTHKRKSQSMYEGFKTYLERHIIMSETEWCLIQTKLYVSESKKGTILLRINQVSQNTYFLIEGCMRTFYVHENGNEATRLILCEGETMAPLASFISQKPSEEALQTLENCKYLRMSRQDFYELLVLIPSWETYFRMRLEAAQILSTCRMESLLNMGAKQRYAQLLQTKPELIQRLPNHIIASYLGITQESLSRIKAKK
jgi:CRP-like cAMP-binding protein